MARFTLPRDLYHGEGSLAELKNLKGEKMRMYEEYAAGTLSLDNYKSKKLECDRKIAEVQDKIEQFKAEESVKSVVPGTVRAAAEQAENFLHGTRFRRHRRRSGRGHHAAQIRQAHCARREQVRLRRPRESRCVRVLQSRHRRPV